MLRCSARLFPNSDNRADYNDTQEYLDNPENSIVVDFNTLANIEPAVLAVYDMPVGTDLEFCLDNTGRYFIDTNTGKRI